MRMELLLLLDLAFLGGSTSTESNESDELVDCWIITKSLGINLGTETGSDGSESSNPVELLE